MEKLFGDYLVRCKVLPAPAEEQKQEVADPDDAVHDQEEKLPFYPFEKISMEEALVRTQTTHVAVLFTAEYCPPCHGFL